MYHRLKLYLIAACLNLHNAKEVSGAHRCVVVFNVSVPSSGDGDADDPLCVQQGLLHSLYGRGAVQVLNLTRKVNKYKINVL